MTAETSPASPPRAGDGCEPRHTAEQVRVTLARTDDSWVVSLTSPGTGRHLSDLLPAVEAFGFHVVDAATSMDGREAHQHLTVTTHHAVAEDDRDRITTALRAVVTGSMPTDPMLELVTSGGLDRRDVQVLLAYRRLFGLLGTTWSPAQVTRTLQNHPDAASALVRLFAALLGPEHDEAAAAAVDHVLDSLRTGMASLTDDRVVADLARAVHATVRTNAWAPNRTVVLPDGRSVELLACKFRSADLPGVPAPVPHAEILVTSTTTSGVHLRGGPVSRGGLRASDRRDDLRSEVLGLLAAQIVKNSVIVPTGAKGGFVLEEPPGAPGDLPDAVADAYRVFVSGLLALTDTVVDGAVVGPVGVVRRDGDDPYLVVAADKGTARMSDTANQLARAADFWGQADGTGFWLGDAFASGGSSGYDHKALGITAAGAWTAIERHFRELGVDVHADSISMVGIGDMSGDVFGNGLLTSDRLRLVAAFDHRDIFLDPDPDPAAAYAERRRLFELPGSSWQDYDRDALSPGGLVVSRQAKQVRLDDRLRDVLGVEDVALSPNAVIRAILRARVDLLYAGGIGTYVVASDEEDVGDAANAPIRVRADEVRARVIGEGANLAITQRARIEFARRGGRVDQDAVHNAGGVAISDREVNLKILFAPLLADGTTTMEERDALLRDATDDVVAGVLEDVDAQVWGLSRQHARSAAELDLHRRHLARLVDAGTVDRQVDVLPDDDELAARGDAGGGLTRPELATVVAATKRMLADAVLDHPLVGSDVARVALRAYVPDAIVAAVGDEALAEHRLADEIVALRIVDDVVNRHGPTLVHELADDHGMPVGDVVAAFVAAQAVLGGRDWWSRLLGLAREVLPDTLDDVASSLASLEAEVAMTLVRDGGVHDLDDLVDALEPIATAIDEQAEFAAGAGVAGRRRLRLLEDLVPDDLAVVAATTDLRSDLADVAALAAADGWSPRPEAVSEALEALALVDERLHVADLRHAVHDLLVDGWDLRQRLQLDLDLRDARRSGAALVMTEGPQAVSTRSDRVGAARTTVRDALSAAARVPAAAPLAVAVATVRRTVERLVG